MNITSKEYWDQINIIATDMVTESMKENDNDQEEAEKLINDSLLHETIDSHEWVIYSNNHLDVMQCSDNDEYYIDNFGIEAAGEALQQGLTQLHMTIVYWCLCADVQNNLDTAFTVYINNLEGNNLEGNKHE